MGLDPRIAAILGVTLAVALILRLVVARVGPVNFVEYERVFLPAPDDIARFAYAGQAYLLAPLFALFGASFDLVFGLNALFLPLLCLGVWSLAMKATEDSRAALAAVLLVGLNPLVLRLSASASETFGFAVLAVMFIDLCSDALDHRRKGWALALLTPFVLIYRPEGLLLAAPVLVITASVVRTRLRQPPSVHILAPLVVTAALFGLFAYLFSGLSFPRITLSLLAGNTQGFLLEMADPRLHSPLLTTCLLAPLALFVPKLRRRLSSPATGLVAAVSLFCLLLVAVWCIQGKEDNALFGSARYLVMAEPWLAVCAALVMALLLRKGWRWAGIAFATLVLFTLPAMSLITEDSNMQKEFDFMVEAVDEIPQNALLVLPSSDENNQEFAPENGMLAVLSMSGKDASWKRVSEVLEEPAPDVFYLFRGFYAPKDPNDALATRCDLAPVLQRTVESSPDVAWYADVPAREEVKLGLYRASCGTDAPPLQ